MSLADARGRCQPDRPPAKNPASTIHDMVRDGRVTAEQGAQLLDLRRQILWHRKPVWKRVLIVLWRAVFEMINLRPPRRASVPTWRRTCRVTVHAWFAEHGWHRTSRCRCAARYVDLTGETWTEAAGLFGVSPGGILNAHARIHAPHPPRYWPAPDRRDTAVDRVETSHRDAPGELKFEVERAFQVAGGLLITDEARAGRIVL